MPDSPTRTWSTRLPQSRPDYPPRLPRTSPALTDYPVRPRPCRLSCTCPPSSTTHSTSYQADNPVRCGPTPTPLALPHQPSANHWRNLSPWIKVESTEAGYPRPAQTSTPRPKP